MGTIKEGVETHTPDAKLILVAYTILRADPRYKNRVYSSLPAVIAAEVDAIYPKFLSDFKNQTQFYVDLTYGTPAGPYVKSMVEELGKTYIPSPK